MNFSTSPIARVLVGAFMISFSGVWVTIAEVPPTTSALYRMAFGFLTLLIAMLFRRERPHLPGRQWFLLLCCGVAFSLDLIVWHRSIQYVGPGLATILGNFQVFLLTAYGALALGETIRPRFLLSLPLAITGLLMIIGIDWQALSGNFRLGLFYGLLTAVCYSVFLLMLRNLESRKEQSSFFALLTMISLVCSILLGAEMVATGGSFFIPGLRSFWALFCLGLFSQAIGWVLIANAMPKIRASYTGLILLLQPALAFAWDVLFFDRPTSLVNWAGVMVALTAIYLGLTSRGARRKAHGS